MNAGTAVSMVVAPIAFTQQVWQLLFQLVQTFDGQDGVLQETVIRASASHWQDLFLGQA